MSEGNAVTVMRDSVYNHNNVIINLGKTVYAHFVFDNRVYSLHLDNCIVTVRSLDAPDHIEFYQFNGDKAFMPVIKIVDHELLFNGAQLTSIN